LWVFDVLDGWVKNFQKSINLMLASSCKIVQGLTKKDSVVASKIEVSVTQMPYGDGAL
jgi:hypothetical protein